MVHRHNGWIKLHRQLLSNPIIKKPMYCHLWNVLLLLAQHRPSTFVWCGQQKTLEPGQLLTGRKQLSDLTGVSETTVERILSCLESGQQIGQQKTNKFRIITIKNWGKYQSEKNGGHQNGQQTDNKRTHTRMYKKKEYSPTSDDVRLSRVLLDLILERKPNFQHARLSTPKGKSELLQKWAVHIDRLFRIDGRTPEQIEAVIRWCQADSGDGRWSGWQNNVLSTEKLRKQIDKLELRMDEQSPKTTTVPLKRDAGGLTPRERMQAK